MKSKAEDILKSIYRKYQDKGLLSVYLYGSVLTEDFDPDKSDIDSIGIVENDTPLKLEDEINDYIKNQEISNDDFSLRFLYLKELDKGKQVGTLTQFIDPRSLLFRFPHWKHVAGKEFERDNFELSEISWRDEMHLRLQKINEWDWNDPLAVSSDQLSYYLKNIAHLVWARQVGREGSFPFSYSGLQKHAKGVEKEVVGTILEHREKNISELSEDDAKKLKDFVSKIRSNL